MSTYLKMNKERLTGRHRKLRLLEYVNGTQIVETLEVSVSL